MLDCQNAKQQFSNGNDISKSQIEAVSMQSIVDQSGIVLNASGLNGVQLESQTAKMHTFAQADDQLVKIPSQNEASVIAKVEDAIPSAEQRIPASSATNLPSIIELRQPTQLMFFGPNNRNQGNTQRQNTTTNFFGQNNRNSGFTTQNFFQNQQPPPNQPNQPNQPTQQDPNAPPPKSVDELELRNVLLSFRKLFSDTEPACISRFFLLLPRRIVC